MVRKTLGGDISGTGNAHSVNCVALHRLLRYAAREAAAQNRFTAAQLIQAAIASLPEEEAVKSRSQRLLDNDLPPPGHC